MLLGMFHGVLQDFLFGIPANDMLASGRRINLGTLDNFTHGGYPSSSRRLEVQDDGLAVRCSMYG
jgi:hypothetical protein